MRMIDLSTRLGISQGHFSNLERGKRPVSDDMAEKIAAILGEPIAMIRESLSSTKHDSKKINSWISNIRINGLPFVNAFRYYVENNGLQNAINKDTVLRNTLKQFIESNIGYSVVAELSENKSVLSHIREKIGVVDVSNSQEENINEQPTGTK